MAMVTDFLIGFLLLLSATINILAFSAFMITPSLRSTSNRFVINLLIVNVIGCIILAPSLLFNSNVIRNLYSEEIITEAQDHVTSATTTPAATTSTVATSSAFNKSSPSSGWPELMSGNYVTATTTTTTTTGHQPENTTTDTQVQSLGSTKATTFLTPRAFDETPYHRWRPWILDLIAAIGAWSLVLVVGDTYVGVTDPLRYHSIVSASRICFLIAIVWCSALGFGGTSAFRFANNHQFQHTLYHTTFRCAYFVCIILIPFCLVCAMYWGIIREARKNGLRLRHNGSSPLLQSVLHIGPQCPSAHERREAIQEAEADSHAYQCCRKETQSISSHKGKYACNTRWLGGGVESSLRRNKSAQFLNAYPTCECCDQILITRSISNQSAYLNGAQHLRLPNRESRVARSSPDLHRNLLPEQSAALEHIRLPRRPTKTLGYMTSIRHRLSNASSLFKYREESRAARISILVVIMFLISYIPFGLLVLTEGHDSFLSTYQQTVLAIFFVVLANIISPLIFAYRNKRVRRGIKRLVSLPAGCASRRQRKGDNNNSIKEPSERNHNKNNSSTNGKSSPRMIKLTRHNTSVEMSRNGLSLQQHDTASSSSASLPLPLSPQPQPHLENVLQRRKLVIFNGKNGQITKVCHPDHHKQQPTQWNIKGYNKDKLLSHKNSCCWTRGEIGCPAAAVHALKLANRANHQKGTTTRLKPSSLQREVPEAEPFLRRFRHTPGQIFKKSRSMIPPDDKDCATKGAAIDV